MDPNLSLDSHRSSIIPQVLRTTNLCTVSTVRKFWGPFPLYNEFIHITAAMEVLQQKAYVFVIVALRNTIKFKVKICEDVGKITRRSNCCAVKNTSCFSSMSFLLHDLFTHWLIHHEAQLHFQVSGAHVLKPLRNADEVKWRRSHNATMKTKGMMKGKRTQND